MGGGRPGPALVKGPLPLPASGRDACGASGLRQPAARLSLLGRRCVWCVFGDTVRCTLPPTAAACLVGWC